jgi:hypothetical protein
MPHLVKTMTIELLVKQWSSIARNAGDDGTTEAPENWRASTCALADMLATYFRPYVDEQTPEETVKDLVRFIIDVARATQNRALVMTQNDLKCLKAMWHPVVNATMDVLMDVLTSATYLTCLTDAAPDYADAWVLEKLVQHLHRNLDTTCILACTASGSAGQATEDSHLDSVEAIIISTIFAEAVNYVESFGSMQARVNMAKMFEPFAVDKDRAACMSDVDPDAGKATYAKTFGPLLKGVVGYNSGSGKGVFVAGGLSAKLLIDVAMGDSDIDLWMVGYRSPAEMEAEAHRIVAKVVANWQTECNKSHVEGCEVEGTVSAHAQVRGNVVNLVLGGNVMHKQCTKIQVVMRAYRTIHEVLTSFDYGPAKAAFDGQRFWVSRTFMLSARMRACIVDPTMASLVKRACKQQDRGFVVMAPEPAEIDRVIGRLFRLTTQKLCEIRRKDGSGFLAFAAAHMMRKRKKAYHSIDCPMAVYTEANPTAEAHCDIWLDNKTYMADHYGRVPGLHSLDRAILFDNPSVRMYRGKGARSYVDLDLLNAFL